MTKLTATYQIKVPSILIEGDELIELDPISLETSIGKILIFPPGSKERKPKSYTEPEIDFFNVEAKVGGSPLWDADILWIRIETEERPDVSEDELRLKLNSIVQPVVYQLLRLIRRQLPETPISLPTELEQSVAFERIGTQISQTTFSSPHTFRVVSKGAGLTRVKWKVIQEEITSGIDTELWENFIIDARVALEEEDLNRATIYAAIACEIFIKEYTEKSAKEKGISQTFWEYLKAPNTETKVLSYFDQVLHLVKGHSMKKENRKTYDRLDRIFQARNKIMHEGKIPPSWNHNKITLLREDIREVEQIISWVRGL